MVLAGKGRVNERKHKATLEVQEYLCISTNDQNLRNKIAFNPATLKLDGVTSFFTTNGWSKTHEKYVFQSKIMLWNLGRICFPFRCWHPFVAYYYCSLLLCFAIV